MKKNSFFEGAMIATAAIFICKIIGLFYVIPFYSIIGVQGGALYSYAYSIYAIFLSLSNSGIPIAMSKVISEYTALDYHYTKERVFKIGSIIISLLGLFFFIILLIFAPMISQLILGDATGGNSIESVTLVIRIVATALLIVPIESVTQGYLQGQKFIRPASMANVVEQIVRVVVIIAGSFLALEVFNLSLETAVGISVFAATIGCLIAYFYLLRIIKVNREKLHRDKEPKQAERKITNKMLVKKIIFYALPFVFIDFMSSAYGIVDTLTVVSTMYDLNYTTEVAELTIGVLTTWGTKLNMIIAAIALGISTSLIPNVAASFVKKDYKDLSIKINQALQSLVITTIPMVVGISLLSGPIWTIFYGYDALSIDIFSIYIIPSVSFSFFTILITITQTINDSKYTFKVLIGNLVGKILLNIPMMLLFVNIGLEAFYAPIVTTFLTQVIASIFLLKNLNKKYKVNYLSTFTVLTKTLLSVAIMFVSLQIINLFISIDVTSRIDSILIVILYGIVGAIIYFVCILKSNLLNEIFGNRIKQLPIINKFIK